MSGTTNRRAASAHADRAGAKAGLRWAVLGRWRSAWREALAAAAAAGLAWWLARELLGHPHPTFAAVTAIICLAPGLPSHGRQAVHILLGVITGILIGEASLLLLPNMAPELRIAGTAFLAIMAALCFGSAPVIAIQASVSAVLVIALGPAMAGTIRLEDVLLGTAVGLTFSQVLMTPDPRAALDAAARRVWWPLGLGFGDAADAVARRDVARMRLALRHFLAARDELAALRVAVAAARSSARWTLRGRLRRSDVLRLAARHDDHAPRLVTAALRLGKALEAALAQADAPPWLPDRLRDIAARCLALADDAPVAPRNAEPGGEPQPSSPVWLDGIIHLETVEEALTALLPAARSPGVSR